MKNGIKLVVDGHVAWIGRSLAAAELKLYRSIGVKFRRIPLGWEAISSTL